MKESSEPVADLVGAITANVYMLLIIAVFVAHILGLLEISRWIGFTSSLVLFPLLYLFVVGLRTGRRKIYFAWLVLMILFVLFELIVDQILTVDLRSQQSSVVPYVMFFFSETGGMIGVASQAGKAWTITTVIIFLILAVYVFRSTWNNGPLVQQSTGRPIP
jgi:phosphoglycerol transferase MdoB-like AlkP superfamily enzyme